MTEVNIPYLKCKLKKLTIWLQLHDQQDAFGYITYGENTHAWLPEELGCGEWSFVCISEWLNMIKQPMARSWD